MRWSLSGASLERRLTLLSLAAAVPVSGLFLALRGWRGGLAYFLTASLVTADFLWMASGVRALLGPGTGVPKGAVGRALLAFAARTVLLLLGLYGILTLLPREGLAAAAGIGAPLILLVAAGAFPSKG